MKRSGIMVAGCVPILMFSATATGGPGTVRSQDGLVIDSQVYDGSGSHNNTCLAIIDSKDITVRNSTFRNCKNNGGAINPENVNGLLVENNVFENSSVGVYAQASTRVKVRNNVCKNINGYGDKGNCVQFNRVTGTRNEISGNQVINDGSGGSTEDLISIYNSHGTQASPIIIEKNCLNGSNNVQATGTGIIAGDGGADWIIVRDNIVINPGSGSISVAGGHNVSLLNNRVFVRGASGSTGKSGQMATWNYGGVGCSNITVRGNQVDILDRNGKRVNGYWNAGGCDPVAGIDDNSFLANLDGLTCPATQSTTTSPPSRATSPAPTADSSSSAKTSVTTISSSNATSRNSSLNSGSSSTQQKQSSWWRKLAQWVGSYLGL